MKGLNNLVIVLLAILILGAAELISTTCNSLQHYSRILLHPLHVFQNLKNCDLKHNPFSLIKPTTRKKDVLYRSGIAPTARF